MCDRGDHTMCKTTQARCNCTCHGRHGQTTTRERRQLMRTEAALQRDRELANARQRAYLARKNARRVVPIDELAVTCWCEETVIRVPRATVLDGRTESCGRPDCTEEAA